jgi:hypothetical protein
VSSERLNLLPDPPQSVAGTPHSEGRLLLIAAAINAVLFAAVFGTLTVGYESNDDVGMAAIASGLMTGKPSAELIYSNLAVGLVLKQLYLWTHRVNWYTAYLLIAHFAAMTGLLSAFLRIRSSLLSVVLFCLLFLEYEVGLLLWLQFTSIAIIAGIVGSLLLTSRPIESGRARLATCYGGFLILLAGLMRSDSLFYGLLVVAPFLADRLIRFRQWRPLLSMGVFLAIVLAAAVLNEWHYRSDPGWRNYRDAAAALMPVLDKQTVKYNEHTRPFFDSVGLSAADFRMMRSNYFADADVFSTERMRQMSSHFRDESRSRDDPWRYLEEHLSPVVVFKRMTYANMLLAFLLCAGGRLRLVLVGGIQGLWVLALLFLLAIYWKIEPRIATPAAFALGIVVFEIVLQTARARTEAPDKTASGKMPLWAKAFALAIVVFVYGWTSFRTVSRHWELSRINQSTQVDFRSLVQQVIDRYVERDPQAIFFNWGATFPFQDMSPFDTDRQVARLRIVQLGWNQLSPLFDQRMRGLGLVDMRHAIIENAPHVYFFMAPTGIETLEQFAKEHYKAEIVPSRIDVLTAGNPAPATGGGLTSPVVQMAPREKAAGRRLTP